MITYKNITIKEVKTSSLKKQLEKLNIKSEDQISTTLRALDKIDRLGWDEARKLLGEGRKDKSGDYTNGANLNRDQIKIIEDSLNNKNPNT